MEENEFRKALEVHNEFQKLYAALGQFLNCFASLEIVLREYLIRLSNMNPEIGAVLYERKSIAKVARDISAIMKYEKCSDLPNLERVLKQIDIIREHRNYIIHNGVSRKSVDKFLCSNEKTSSPIKQVRGFDFNIKDLHFLEIDTSLITSQLSDHLNTINSEIIKDIDENWLPKQWYFKSKFKQ